MTTVVLDVLELRAEQLTSPMSATVEGDFEGGTFELEARLGAVPRSQRGLVDLLGRGFVTALLQHVSARGEAILDRNLEARDCIVQDVVQQHVLAEIIRMV